jgi:regulator of sirC expression with transglutaminase-like and TPR domain
MIAAIAHLGLVEEAEIEIDKAALEIAALDHPQAAPEPYLALVDSMGAKLRAHADARLPGEQAMALGGVLAGEFGFDGDRETYDDPDNADLMRVIDRRRGLPVALAILYVAVARRAGWAAYALNTPGHVLVGVGASTPCLMDPFNRGALLARGQLSNLLTAALGGPRAIRPEHVAPMTNRGVLVRLMMNQASRAEQAGDVARARELMQRITTVSPSYPQGWWDRARLERAAGDGAAARDSLSAMLEITRDPEIRRQVIRALEALSG